ncbi:cell division protein FtsK [Parafrankia sp. BMG5.11]|uniref:cell division protein FtsK n=1 Tax=Parafrankia sp. BMG5.11 TaxID=222540 RepID=UPI00103AB664|nr:cell division protein FtsK [Parafrankia sp. BMG5.11]TCJ35905.1 cell division protein FtsK [Parafrankia sp. BMG5.11]
MSSDIPPESTGAVVSWVPDVGTALTPHPPDVRTDGAVLPYPPPPLPASRDRSFDVALDPIDSGRSVPVPVDPPTPPPVDVERRPIIPPSFTRAQLPATVRHAAGRWAHITAYHLVRVPWYLPLILATATVGAVRLAARHAGWVSVAEQAPLRRAAVEAGDTATWLKLHKEARGTRRTRAMVLVAELAGVVLGATALPGVLAATPRPLVWLATAGVVVGLAQAGRPAGRPLIAPAVVTPRFRKLNADIVLRAYYAARLGAPDKPGQEITFGSAMAREGNGSRVAVDLPYGKGFGEAVKARDAIASGLDVATTQVFLIRDKTSHRRHVLWVADRDPLALPAGRTPLLACRPTDIWTPAPFGLDERGGKVTIDLLWNSILVGAQPRQGKTFTLRGLGLFAALDPYVKLSVFDGGGKPDWRRFALVADRCAFGLAPTRDGDPIDILRYTLRDIKTDVQDRYVRLSDLPADICPEGKLTRDIARDPRYGMPVRLLLIDEFQEYFNTGDSEADKEIADLLVYLIRVAPAAGVIIGTATQRPSGIGSGDTARKFTDFRDNHIVRFALRTGSWQVSDLVLGSGAFSEGLDSSTLLPEHKGVGMLRGASEHTPTVRTYLADAQDTEKILTVARAVRERAGMLTGHAAGHAPPTPARDILTDVLTVFGEDAGLHWQQITERLAAHMPEHYTDATPDAISAQLRALGAPSVDVKRHGQVLKGARRVALAELRDRRALPSGG